MEGFLKRWNVKEDQTFYGGFWEYFYEDGTLKKTEFYKVGEIEERTTYHENGKKSSQGQLLKGQREGPWEMYHNNGQIHFKGFYKNGKFEGVWKTYAEDGQLEHSVIYENGERIK